MASSSPRRPLVVVAVVAVVLVAGVGVWRWAVADDSDDAPGEAVPVAEADIVVLGDSVTFMSAEEIIDSVVGHGPIAVVGRPGFRTDQLLPEATRAISEVGDPDVVVVMSGYNDVWQDHDTAPAIVEMVDLMAEVDCAVWVLIPTKGPWPEQSAVDLNDLVEERAAATGVHVETAWRDAVDDTDGPGPDLDLITDDEVHPAAAGAERLAEVMAAAVDRFCS